MPVTAPMRADISCTTTSAIGHGDHDPEQEIAELRSGGGVGVNTAGVVVHIRGDEPRTDDGQEHQQADSPDFKASGIGHDTGTYGER